MSVLYPVNETEEVRRTRNLLLTYLHYQTLQSCFVTSEYIAVQIPKILYYYVIIVTLCYTYVDYIGSYPIP
jgi:hypothetical protein